MQCQSQLDASRLKKALAIKASINSRNVAWFANRHTIECEEESMEPFEDIDCMTIERFHKKFIKTKGDPQFRVVNLGPWSVNVKDFIKFQTAEPGKFMMYRKIYRGYSHHRKRPDRL